MTELRNGDRKLALHELQDGSGTPLLLLHALYASSACWKEATPSWPGPVYALDFAGHGASSWVRGGWYCAEECVADADLALAAIGEAALAGTGLGAYVALLLAGARASQVRSALLLPGSGLAGGGSLPDPSDHRDAFGSALPAELSESTDPMARCIERDVRPVGYAQSFVDAAPALVLCEPQGGAPGPDSWEVVRAGPRTLAVASRSEAFEILATHALGSNPG